MSGLSDHIINITEVNAGDFMAWGDTEAEMATHGTARGAKWAAIERERILREERWREMDQLHAASPDLLDACRAMLECTGGSEHWNGETHDALLKIEAAVAKAIKS